MKHLILMSDDNEIFYDMKDINKIVSDYAQNLYNEADLRGNDIKPLEMLTVRRWSFLRQNRLYSSYNIRYTINIKGGVY